MSNNELIEYIKTCEYKTNLNNYISSKSIIILLIICIICLPVFYKIAKKYKKKSNFKIKDSIIPILFGITICLIYNITILNLNIIFNFTNILDSSNNYILSQLICSGILGPILEELIFRGIVYNQLKEFNKPMTSIIITSIIFGLMHSNILDCIYAFGVSFIFIFLYEKYKDLKAPIIMHISLNVTIVLIYNIINKNIVILNLFLIIISIVILLFLRKKIIKDA